MAEFSFMGCVKRWDQHQFLRHRARDLEILIVDHKNRKRKMIVPSLANLKLNEPVLRPFTLEMVEFGRVAKPVALIKAALRAFYCQEHPTDIQIDETKLSNRVMATAHLIKRMLTPIRRKFTRWEMPRDS